MSLFTKLKALFPFSSEPLDGDTMNWLIFNPPGFAITVPFSKFPVGIDQPLYKLTPFFVIFDPQEVEIDGKKYLLKEEFEKFFVRGNKTAATRIRKFMQLIKTQSQEIRDDVQEYRQKL